MSREIVWTIAGSDSSGGAGIQCDLKTLDHLGVHGCSVITAVTAQNNQGIIQVDYLSGDSVEAQINSLHTDFYPKAIKIGMLGHIDILEHVSQYLSTYSEPVVLDPLLISSTGKNLFNEYINNYLSKLKNLFASVDLVTPNILEAEKIICREIRSHEDIEIAGKELISLGAKNILIKGGHLSHDNFSQDYWTNGVESFWLSSKRYAEKNYRGTGCTLSSAIAACLALGYNIKDSIVIAKMVVSRGIRLSTVMQHDSAVLNHSAWPEDEEDLPYLTHQPIHQPPARFNSCDPGQLGLYPVIDSIDWVKKLLSAGVKTLQLRIKNKNGIELENELRDAIHLAKQYQAKLFINDYWELAVRLGAYGVHLGQEDLHTADINMIRDAGLRLGISTHCYYEVARAHSFNPSYIACGPVFPTTTKMMAFSPLGISQLKRWRKTLNYPLVAIGGIGADNIHEVIQTKVDGIAMISAITKADDPVRITKKLLHDICSSA